jgi:hypothetical protein
VTSRLNPSRAERNPPEPERCPQLGLKRRFFGDYLIGYMNGPALAIFADRHHRRLR